MYVEIKYEDFFIFLSHLRPPAELRLILLDTGCLYPEFCWALFGTLRDEGPCYVINTAGGQRLLATNLTHLL